MSLNTQPGSLENHFEPVFKYATVGIIVTGSKGEIVAANPYVLNGFGYSVQELSGQSIEILIPARYHSKHRGYHKEFIAQPVTRLMGAAMELYAIRKDGIEVPVEISLSNYNYNGGHYVISFITDISLRKRNEQLIEKLHVQLKLKVEQRTAQLSHALQQLELIQAFQKAILDNAGVMIVAADEKGIILHLNPEASLNTGYDKNEVIGIKTPILFHAKKEIEVKRKALKNEFGINISDDYQVLVEKARRGIHSEEKYTYIKKNGETFPVSLTITSIKNEKGTILGFIGVALDISDRIKA